MESLKNIQINSVEKKKKIIESCAGEAYTEIASTYSDYFGNDPKEIFWQNACQQFAEVMKKKLKEKGIDSIYRKIDVKRIAPNSKPHFTLLTKEYIVDGTWQQFLENPRNNNQTLFLNINSIESDLQNANVPKNLYFIYEMPETKEKVA